MEIRYEAEAKRIEVRLPDTATREAFLKEARGQEAFHLDLPEPVRAFQVYRVSFPAADAGSALECDALAVQLFDQGAGRHGATFQVETWHGEPKEPAAGAGPTGGRGELSSSPAIFRIQQMTVPQRRLLAPKADRNERAVLLRDTSAQVLQGLLVNPRLSGEDVLRLVRSTHASGSMLKRIAGDRRWASNAEIQAALVRNPKTPSPVAVRLIEVLRTADLRTLAKMQGLKENLRRAALRVYLKRTGQG